MNFFYKFCIIRPGNFLEGLFESLPRVLGYIAPLVSLIVVIANIITLINEPNAPIQDKILLVIQIFAGLMETAFLALGLVVEELLANLLSWQYSCNCAIRC